VWEIIMEYIDFTRKSGYFEAFRKEQAVVRMHSTILEYLNNSFYNQKDVKEMVAEVEHQLHEGTITSYKAALKLLNKYFKRLP
jgi:LAO/AO transport system kinase